jgi:hypothetical protein
MVLSFTSCTRKAQLQKQQQKREHQQQLQERQAQQKQQALECPTALTDVAYPVTRVFVTRANRALGYVRGHRK